MAAAFLSLRDVGLIRIFIRPERKVIGSLNRVWIERSDLAAEFSHMPLVEGGLLMACEELAHKRFGKSDTPGVTAVIQQLTRNSQDDVFKWVEGLARLQAEQLGLYALPASRESRSTGWSTSPLATTRSPPASRVGVRSRPKSLSSRRSCS